MNEEARQYRGPADAELLSAFLVALRSGGNHACWHTGDLVWRFFLHSLGHDLGDTVRLWLDAAGHIQAFAILTPRSPAGNLLFDLQVRPGARAASLLAQALAWIEGRAAATKPAPALLCTDTGVYDVDVDQAGALRARGFRPVGGGALLLARSLAEPIAMPRLPGGFRLRPVAGLEEAGARSEAHRDSFDSKRVTVEAYRRLMCTPGYAPQWDLVAEAPDGTIAAFCLVWPDTANGTGEFEPVATRPAYRRQGLAQALLLAGLRRLADAGARTAVVGPIDGSDGAALALYRSAGFEPVHLVSSYAREWSTDAAAALPKATGRPGTSPRGGETSGPQVP